MQKGWNTDHQALKATVWPHMERKEMNAVMDKKEVKLKMFKIRIT